MLDSRAVKPCCAVGRPACSGGTRPRWPAPLTTRVNACARCSRPPAPPVPLLINDDVDLAAALQAEGVHLGQDVQAKRQSRLGPAAIVGWSVGTEAERERLRAAGRAPDTLDYIGVGPAFYRDQGRCRAGAGARGHRRAHRRPEPARRRDRRHRPRARAGPGTRGRGGRRRGQRPVPGIRPGRRSHRDPAGLETRRYMMKYGETSLSRQIQLISKLPNKRCRLGFP